MDAQPEALPDAIAHFLDLVVTGWPCRGGAIVLIAEHDRCDVVTNEVQAVL